MSATSKTEKIKQPRKSVASRSAIAPSKAPRAVDVDNTLLQKLRLHWQLGDWRALEIFSEQDIESVDERAECALYIAAACYQLGNFDKGKIFQTLTLQWGGHKADIARVMVSGVYNTLAIASVIAHPENSIGAKARFSEAAEIALPGVAVPAVVTARTRNQIEQLQSDVHSKIKGMVPSIEFIQPVSAAELEDVDLLLRTYYVFDDTLQIWRKDQPHEFLYTDGDAIEQRILHAVRGCSDVSVFSQELLKHQTDWPSEYHLSADRVNLLRPFTDKLRRSTVLELGCGCGAITRFLGETAKTVVAVEGSQQRATIAAERCRDLDNVTFVLDKLQDAPFAGQFDVVTLIGVLEYSNIYVDADEPIQYVLQKALSYLKDDGVLIVAIENQLGLKYFAGAPEDHGVGVMSGINDLYAHNTAVTFGKKELEDRLVQAGFSAVETYLPFPDYKLPCLIVHPQGYKTRQNWDLGTLLSCSVFYDRQGVASPLFSLESAWPLIARNGLAADLANSHLFVAHKHGALNTTDPKVLASYYSPKRTESTSQELIFFQENEEISIARRRLSQTVASAEQTIENYQRGTLHSQMLHKVLQRNGWTLAEVEAWLQPWLDALQLAASPEAELPLDWSGYDHYVPSNYIDAIPRNLMVMDTGFHQFIDLEWTLPHPLPLPMVLYRGLVVTLSAVTSVAQPADPTFVRRDALLNALMRYCGYQLTEQDYALFVPVFENLSRASKGYEPDANPSRAAIELKPFKVRRTGNANTDDRHIGMTAYWSNSDDGFSEDRSYKKTFSSSGKVQQVVLDIARKSESYRRFRLDIADCPGCFVVSALALHDSNAKLLWQWDFNVSGLKHVGQLSFYRTGGENSPICLLSEGYDPQFELDLPEQVLAALSHGGTLTVSLQSFL